MRQRINISIAPAFYDDLERICKKYGFANLCEICTVLLRVFADRVNNAERNKKTSLKSNEELIKDMFAEFENWEPTPQPGIMYKRHFLCTPDSLQNRYPKSSSSTVSLKSNALNNHEQEEKEQNDDDVCVYGLDYLERSYNYGADDSEEYDE